MLSLQPGGSDERVVPVVAAYDWLYIGSYGCRVSPFVLNLISNFLFVPLTIFRGRVTPQRWVRYWICPSDVHSGTPPAPRLTPVTDEIIRQLRNHPDRTHNELQSGLRWWDHGLRRAYVWLETEGPLCIQWLLTDGDNAKLRTLPIWAGMYPPLPPERGQVEHLLRFTNAGRGVATQFARAMYEEARRAGLRDLITHIHENNVPARVWAERTGWRRYGTITRYGFDLPGLRDLNICLHRTSPSRQS